MRTQHDNLGIHISIKRSQASNNVSMEQTLVLSTLACSS